MSNSKLPPPGQYWLVTKLGSKKQAIVVDDWVFLIRQESMWNGNEWHGDTWWQPPLEYIEEAGWTFVPRIVDHG